ncbi:hypothetical protein [Streptomyces sp. TRM49041]|uniref:hypothetical protein n=1 Tax=Streptomyces sp. TRM49041 TaxID=2603216 RepID=UPI0037DA2CF7
MPMSLEQWRECWARAEGAAEGLREALSALGVPQVAYGAVRPVVTHNGRVYVDVGMLRGDAAVMVAEALKPAGGSGP